MKEYMLKRYHSRRLAALEHLGSKCVDCSAEQDLEFDHIDPSSKRFTIAKMWSVNEKDFWMEVEKCQLLCKECHRIKTLEDNGQLDARLTHGTLSSYRYCKCEECKAAMSTYNRNYKATLRNSIGLE